MRRLRLPLIATATLLAWTTLLGAAEPQQVKSAKDVVFKLTIDRTTVPLSGACSLTLTAAGPAALEIDPITSVVTSKDWEAHAEAAVTRTQGRRGLVADIRPGAVVVRQGQEIAAGGRPTPLSSRSRRLAGAAVGPHRHHGHFERGCRQFGRCQGDHGHRAAAARAGLDGVADAARRPGWWR